MSRIEKYYPARGHRVGIISGPVNSFAPYQEWKKIGNLKKGEIRLFHEDEHGKLFVGLALTKVKGMRVLRIGTLEQVYHGCNCDCWYLRN